MSGRTQKLADGGLTPAQAEAKLAVEQHGSIQAAARALGKDQRAVSRALQRAGIKYDSRPGERSERGWQKGEDDEFEIDRPVPDGLKLHGLSDMRRNAEGLPVWYKFSEDRERLDELMRAAVEAMKGEIPPAEPVDPPDHFAPDLANLFVLTDYHIGSRSWPEETRDEAWDTKIAEDLLYRWFAMAIESAPKADTAVFAQLGDFLDHDGLIPVTPTSGHVMDADSRYQLLVRIAIRAMRRVIQLLLSRHNRVIVIAAEGNHDLSGSAWLREALAALYEDEPRIHVDTSPDPYYAVEFGQVALFFHHGHLKRPRNGLDAVFTAKFRQIFGRTKHVFAHVGHLHHVDIKESPLMLVEQHRTLSARNSHESRGGWISGRDAAVITYHREFGRVGQSFISPEMAMQN